MANNKVYVDYLMHGRTKGSRNGISTTKGYTAVGQKAKGRWVNGRYVYENNTPKVETKGHWVNGMYVWETKPSGLDKPNNIGIGKQIVEERNKNARAAAANPKVEKAGFVEARPAHYRAVNQHNAEVAGKNAALAYAQKKRKQSNIGASQAADTARMNTEVFNRVLSGKSNSAIVPMDKDTKEHYPSYYTGKNKELKSHVKPEFGKAHVDVFNYDDSSRAALKKGAQNNWQQQANAAASGKPSGYNNAHYNAVRQAAAERNAKEVALGRQKKASYQKIGKANNWQQTANKTAGILGNMSREDRSLMKSQETRYHDKNGKLHINGGFNVNNKYGYSNYTKDDKGWYDVHIGEYNTAGVKGVKKQQDWNASFERNHRSDIGNAIADAKEDAKKAFKEAKADAKQTYVNLKSKFKSKFKKKKK